MFSDRKNFFTFSFTFLFKSCIFWIFILYSFCQTYFICRLIF